MIYAYFVAIHLSLLLGHTCTLYTLAVFISFVMISSGRGLGKLVGGKGNNLNVNLGKHYSRTDFT